MIPVRPRRSALYIPGANARALAKAPGLDADVLIFDLEDSAGPEEKAAAREAVRTALRADGYGSRERVVRINALETPWGTEDLLAAVAGGADAVLVPKVKGPADIAAIAGALDAMDADGHVRIWAMIETARAILDVGAIAGASAAAGEHKGLAALVIGTNDLARETGASLNHGRMAIVPWLQGALAAARAHGLAILDGVFNDLSDADGFAAECRQGRQLGMDGKTLIHPRQIAPANDAFGPGAAEIADAEQIVTAFAQPENREKSVIRLGDRMVERLHLEIAERTLAIVAAIAKD